MTRLLRSLLAKVDVWPPTRLLWIDVALALFVGIAHGGAFVAARSSSSPDLAEVESLAVVSLPLAALVLLSGALGLALPRVRVGVLSLHGAVFGIAAIEQLIWGADLLIHGIPQGNFSWSVGLFSVMVAYAVYVLSRYTVPSGPRAHPSVFFSPAFALAIAAVIDVGVFLRFTHELGVRFGS